jgi:hypothetical protein
MLSLPNRQAMKCDFFRTPLRTNMRRKILTDMSLSFQLSILLIGYPEELLINILIVFPKTTGIPSDAIFDL